MKADVFTILFKKHAIQALNSILVTTLEPTAVDTFSPSTRMDSPLQTPSREFLKMIYHVNVVLML